MNDHELERQFLPSNLLLPMAEEALKRQNSGERVEIAIPIELGFAIAMELASRVYPHIPVWRENLTSLGVKVAHDPTTRVAHIRTRRPA
jgi:hypothetical protein